jgi:uncharacterized protein YkwD
LWNNALAGERGTRRRLALLALLTLVALLAGACDLLDKRNGDDDADHGPPEKDAAMAAAVVEQINAHRTGRGLSALLVDDAVANVAASYSCRMADEDFFAHEDPQGQQVDARLQAASVRYFLVGENLARNENVDDPVVTAVEGWVASPTHSENIFRPEFTHTGVGVCKLGRIVYFTQLFTIPAD